MESYKDGVASLWENATDGKGFEFVKMYSSKFLTGLTAALPVFGAAIQKPTIRDGCPGYAATNVHTTATGLTADLSLAGPACNVYGNDVKDLRLLVNYDSGISRLSGHVT
jgi:hypothetical protein